MNDPEYKRKLELSYIKCLDELCYPDSEWEEIIGDAKFIMDPETGKPKTSHSFILDYPDNIDIQGSSHSYVFKRSHFYSMFLKKSSRIKRDLIKCWRERGYYVNISFDENLRKWRLDVFWRS